MNIKTLSGVSQQDMQGKGNVGRPNPPGVSVEEMQRILDELPREVIVPALNRVVASQNENNALFAEKAKVLSEGLSNKLNKADALEKDNTAPFTPVGNYNPATVLFVKEQVESHAASDQLHISDEERRLGRLAERISASAPAGSFTPSPGEDFALTADSDVTLILKAPSKAGSSFLSMKGFLAIGADGSAEWGSGMMFPNGAGPDLEAGNCYLLEYFFHPKVPGSTGGKWSVRCTKFQQP